MPIWIETERLLLRTWQASDIPPFAALNADPEVMRYFPSTRTLEETQETVALFTSKYERDGFCFAAVERRDTGEFIGFVGLNKPDYQVLGIDPYIEIGWRLAKQQQGLGFATEAAQACLQWAWKRGDIATVYAITPIQNKASERVMQKIGMRLRQTFPHPLLEVNHALSEHVLYWIDAPK